MKLRPSPVRELNEAGYELVDDVPYLPTAELLRLPEMGGRGSRSSPGPSSGLAAGWRRCLSDNLRSMRAAPKGEGNRVNRKSNASR
ncbi:hypothetical protein CN085_29740 [Sinorhizobium meliloti]|nr:hypothetical protein CN087_00345 [Sinorhizobium meliloti]RVP08581.1 hypothetical protein CN085_29740 [Sinorhizobium meliloti]RVQ62584.1 hypothetical protein CN245_00425 [Sinorhizobium meliloti]